MGLVRGWAWMGAELWAGCGLGFGVAIACDPCAGEYMSPSLRLALRSSRPKSSEGPWPSPGKAFRMSGAARQPYHVTPQTA